MPFQFIPTELPEVIEISPKIFDDNRGYFLEHYKRSEFFAAGITVDFVQDNFSVSQKNVIRGLHFQKSPKAQAKLVSVALGKVFDVAVDIRKDSPTFGKYVARELSSDNHHMLYIPAGFAHGFLALTDNCRLHYKVSAEYDSNLDAGILYNDPKLAIAWPVTEHAIISDKDRKLPLLRDI